MNYLQAIAVRCARHAFVVYADHAQTLNAVTALLYLTMTLENSKLGKIDERSWKFR
jgi:hypothetical protein